MHVWWLRAVVRAPEETVLLVCVCVGGVCLSGWEAAAAELGGHQRTARRQLHPPCRCAPRIAFAWQDFTKDMHPKHLPEHFSIRDTDLSTSVPGSLRAWLVTDHLH